MHALYFMYKNDGFHSQAVEVYACKVKPFDNDSRFTEKVSLVISPDKNIAWTVKGVVVLHEYE